MSRSVVTESRLRLVLLTVRRDYGTSTLENANTDVASTAVPLAIIPQVILAGMIMRLEGFSEFIAWFAAPSYWCFGSMSHVWNNLWEGVSNSDGMLAQQELVSRF